MSELIAAVIYVETPLKSADFYKDVIGKEPVFSSPTFVMFSMDNGSQFGLWSKHTVVPSASNSTAGAAEYGFTLKEKSELDALYQSWGKKGITMIQEPTEMGFGYTFTAVDPDGHRLRVYVPSQP